jgi:Predicted choline kinase involved in LPS biosynthesis
MTQMAVGMQTRVNAALNTWQSWPLNLRQAPRLVKVLDSGGTNRSYLIEAKHDKYSPEHRASFSPNQRRLFCLRVNTEQSQALGINRNRELDILHVLQSSNLVPKLLHFDRALDFSLFEYAEGRTWSRHDLTRLSQRERLFSAIEQFQRVSVNISRFNYLAHINGYIEELDKRQTSLSEAKRSELNHYLTELDDFMRTSWQPVLCHHDLIPENIIETDNGLVLLDWEYAGLGHPEFDRRYVKQCLAGGLEWSVEGLHKGDTVDKLIYWLVVLWQALN